jgi:hypothetical protein
VRSTKFKLVPPRKKKKDSVNKRLKYKTQKMGKEHLVIGIGRDILNMTLKVWTKTLEAQHWSPIGSLVGVIRVLPMQNVGGGLTCEAGLGRELVSWCSAH